MNGLKHFCHKTAIISLLVAFTLPPIKAYSHHNCEVYDKKVKKIKAKMRQGYTIKQGEKLKKSLTKWQNKRRECEMTNHKYKKKRKAKTRTE